MATTKMSSTPSLVCDPCLCRLLLNSHASSRLDNYPDRGPQQHPLST